MTLSICLRDSIHAILMATGSVRERSVRAAIFRKLHTCFGLAGPDRRLAMRSIVLVGFVRLWLWLLPLKVIERVCGRLGRTRRGGGAIGVRQIVWAVRL